jgi:hypothetical protein
VVSQKYSITNPDSSNLSFNINNLEKDYTTKAKKSNHKVISKLHKFSIGKVFDSTELDNTHLAKLNENKTIYMNVPATLSTRTISAYSKLFKLRSKTNMTSSDLNAFFSSISLAKKNTAMSKSSFPTINLNNINKKTGSDMLNKILNDILVDKYIDYEKLSKGRSIEDTKAVINYMILALHQIKFKEQPNFNSMKYLDEV